MLTLPTYTMLTHNERIQLSRQRFKAIYALTLDILNMTPKQAPHSKGYNKCWSDLLGIWEKYQSSLGIKNIIFYALVHLCFQGFPTRIIDRRLKELILMVEQELLEDGCAFKTWRECGIIEQNFEALNDYGRLRYRGPRLFFTQSSCRAYREVMFEGKQYVSSNRNRWEFMAQYSFDVDITESFEQAITQLLPESASWTSQWHDLRHIHKRLNEMYGINYSAAPQSFDRMIDGIAAECLGEYTSPKLMAIDNFSMAMAHAVWGDKAEKRIAAYFEYAYTQASRKDNRTNNSVGFTFRSIHNSWVYREMLELENQKSPLITAEIRKHLFNVPIWA